MQKRLKNINRQKVYFFILLFFLFIPNLFVLFYFKDIKGDFTMEIAYMVLSILVWLLPLTFLPKKIYFAFGFLFLFVSPLEIIFVKNLGTPITLGYIDSVFNTNFEEAKEQIISNIGFAIFYAILLSIYLILLSKIKNSYISKRIRISILILFLLFNVTLFYKMYEIQKIGQATKKETLVRAYKTMLSKYSKVYPLDLILNINGEIKNNKKVSEFNKDINEFTFHAKSLNDRKEEEIFVLVIGETSRYNNFHVNGYFRETTPFLDKTENLLSFKNVYSCAYLTEYSIPLIITRANPEHKDLQYKEKTILDAFKEAGFYTAWIANQSSEKPIIKRLQKTADFFKSNLTDIDTKKFHDEDVIPDFQEILNNNSNKKFIVIHSLGSHFRYSNRYPEQFKKFTPEISETGYNNLDYRFKKELINSYDNSILYTDHFLDLLIQNLEKKNTKSILLFVPDHGENLYDNEQKYFGHGSLKPLIYEYHIPYFIWYSKEYEKSHPNKILSLKSHINVPISSSCTFYTLLDLANIQYDNSNNELIYSISSDKYQIPQKRYVVNSANETLEVK